MGKSVEKTVLKALLLYPDENIRELVQALEKGRVDYQELSARKFHQLFTSTKEKDFTPSDRWREVNSALDTLKKQSKYQERAELIRKLLLGLSTNFDLGSADFWTHYWRCADAAEGKDREKYLRALEKELYGSGLVSEVRAKKLARFYLGTDLKLEEIENITSGRAISILPSIEAARVKAIRACCDGSMLNLLDPNGKAGLSGRVSLSQILEDSSTLRGKKNLKTELNYFNSQSKFIREAESVSALDRLMEKFHLSAREVAIALLLSSVEVDRSNDELDEVITGHLEDLGLQPESAAMLVGSRTEASETERSNVPASDTRTPKQIDEVNWEDAVYLHEQGRVVDAYQNVQKRMAGGDRPLTQRYKDAVAAIEKSYLKIDTILKEGYSAGRRQDFVTAESSYARVRAVDVDFPGLGKLKKIIAEQKMLRARQLEKECIASIGDWDLPTARNCIAEIRNLHFSNLADELESKVQECMEDAYWGFRPGQPGELLNPGVDMTAFKSSYSDRKYWKSYAWMLSGLVLAVLLGVVNYFWSLTNEYSSMRTGSSSGIGHFILGSIKPTVYSFLFLFFLSALVRKKSAMLRWLPVGLGVLFAFTSPAIPVAVYGGKKFFDVNRSAEKRIAAAEKAYSDLRERSLMLKSKGPSEDVFGGGKVSGD